MAKKKYRVYKSGGTQGRVMNPTAQFLARAQEGMQQPSPEEMAMMQQQAMQQQGQPQMQQQQGGQDQMMQQLVAAIGQAMQNGAQPEEVVAKLLQDQVEPEMVAEALVELGMPMQEVDQLMASVIQQLQGGQEQGQPSEEEMMAMQQQQMAEQAPPQEQPAPEAPMSKGGYVKKKLKRAQEGMEQNGVKASNTNLAAEDDVNNVSALLEFSKNNALKNQYEQEYDQMQGNQDMMPEARLGREARQERREIRQDERTDRTEMRQVGRTARQANRLANRAVRQASSPFGSVPGFSAHSPSPFMGSSIRLEDVERGLFGRLKNFKMSIDGMGFPARFSEGMFMNALQNPYGMPAGQSKIVKMITLPGQVVDETVVEKKKEITFKQKEEAKGSGPSTAFQKYFANDMQQRLNDIKNGKFDTGSTTTAGTDAGGLPLENTPVLVDAESKDLDVTDDAVTWWVIGGVGTTLVVGDILLNVAQLKKATKNGAKTLGEAAAMEGTKATAEQVAEAAKGPTFRERMRANVQGKPQMRNPLSGKYQSKPQTVRGYAKQKSANALRQGYKYGMNKPYKATTSRLSKIIKGIAFLASKGKIKQDGGYVDSMDQDYGNPDLYRFTGGGDYDYFADGGYYEDGGFPQYEDVNDPYMPYMQDGGYIPMANDGLYVDTGKQTYQEYLDWHNKDKVEEGYSRAEPLSEKEWMTEQGFKSQVNPNSGNTTKDLYNSLSDAQKEMYKTEYQRRQQRGQGMQQRGYGMQGYGRRGLFNSVMGINAPGAIQRRQYLSQIAGPTYADGTPVIGGALPEGYHLRTGDKAGIEFNKINLMDRLQGQKGPRKSIKYYFEGPNDTTPSLAGGNNGISNFKPSPSPNINPAPNVPAGPAIDPGREGFNADSDGNGIPDYLQYENTAPGMREAENQPAGPVNDPSVNRGIKEKGAYIGNKDLDNELGDRGSLMTSGKDMRNSRKENRAERRQSSEEIDDLQIERMPYVDDRQSPPSELMPAEQNYFYNFDEGVPEGPQNQNSNESDFDGNPNLPAMPANQFQQTYIGDQYPSNSRVNAVQGDYPGFIGNSIGNVTNYDEGGESRRSNRKFAKEQLPLKNKISREARKDLRIGLNKDEITRDEYLTGVEEKASQIGSSNYNYTEDIYGNLGNNLENETASEDPSYSTPEKLLDVTMEDLAENQRILDEQKAKAKAKAKAVPKNNPYQGKLSSLKVFPSGVFDWGDDSYNEEWDSEAAGDNPHIEAKNKVYYPRLNKMNDWRNTELDKIKRDTSLSKEKRKKAENSIWNEYNMLVNKFDIEYEKKYKMQNGGYQEGDEVYMNPQEVSQFMAAGGQIEFL
jgi:hypothetical protein